MTGSKDLLGTVRWGVDARLSRLTMRVRWAARSVLSGNGAAAGVSRPRRACFLCTTWRSGSTFLGDALLAAADLDLSREPLWLKREQATLGAVLTGRSLRLYLDGVIERGTNPSGIFGTKVMWPDFRATLARLQTLAEFRSQDELGVLRAVFGEPVFLFLTRSDKLRQAISLYRARATRVWHRDHSGRVYMTPGRALADVDYDFAAIRAARDRILREEERWRDFFRRNGIAPLELTYDELCEDLQAAVGRVLAHIGEDSSRERVERAHSKYVKLADARTEEWVARFQAESAPAARRQRNSAAAAAGRPLELPRHFLGIGAQRSGTTWLYRHLRRHPEIWLPPVKEVHYFDRSARYPTPSHHDTPPGLPRLSLAVAGSGVEKMIRRHMDARVWYREAERHRWSAAWFSLRYPFAAIDEEWYGRLFSYGGDRITGDITPGYGLLTDADVAAVKTLLPEARIVMVLRNPIERAWSNFKLDCRTRGVDIGDPWIADMFLRRPDVFLRGDYPPILTRWRSCFGEDRVYVGYYDDLVDDPDAFLRGILRFLGARSDVGLPGLNQRVNTSAADRVPDAMRRALARQYEDSLRRLCALLPGGRAEAWLQELEGIVA